MIDRYVLPQMKKLWTDEFKFTKFLEVELAVVKAYNNISLITDEEYNKIKNNASFDLQRIYELEEQTKHDVIAFTRAVSESLGEEKKWIHYGLTSTDVVDTANALIIKEANEIIYQDLIKLQEVLKEKAINYQNVPCMGRTHGMHAEITSFGLKYALWFDELQRNIQRFKEARADIEVGKLSGAVGNYVKVSKDIEIDVCKMLNIGCANISTQVLSRDRHANYLFSLALIASLLEKIATEIRHLSRSEVREVSEYFSSNQKGSSAMPHKKNPISSENICGCARIIKSYVNVGLENNILWHERDISHSSAERIVLSDATLLIDYMINRMVNILKNLLVYEDKMLENIYLTHGVIFSGVVLNKIVEKNSISREKAYDLVQKLSFDAINEKKDFKELVKIQNLLTDKDLDECFDINQYLKNVKRIYKEVGIE